MGWINDDSTWEALCVPLCVNTSVLQWLHGPPLERERDELDPQLMEPNRCVETSL